MLKLTVLLLAALPLAAQLPEMRIEPAGEGSYIFLRNVASQPLSAWLIELVGYPGSSFSLWQDELANPIPPGGERRISVASKMVGAVPEYVKVQAALFGVGSYAGAPEKVKILTGHRGAKIETIKELIR